MDLPTVEIVILDGQPVYRVSGHGTVVEHQQKAQALLMWHCRATAAGYEGPPPILC